jgi:predicted TIM-barrel fold metal-dependent hydrolase
MAQPTGRRYEIISADSHVVEPPDLWEKWLPRKYLDRAPRLVKDAEGGDAWLYDPDAPAAPLGLVSCVGVPKDQMRWTGYRYGHNVHPSVYDGKARLEVLDTDGVDAELLYPPQRAIASFTRYNDKELIRAGIAAYNQWLQEDFCAAEPTRLFGVYQIPNLGLDTAVSELRQAHTLGFRGAVIAAWPTGNPALSRDDDPFWRTAEELQLPISMHFGLATQREGHTPAREAAGAVGAVVGMARMAPLLVDLIFSGVFDRFPRLHVVGVEVGAGWIPHAAEMMDDRYWRNRAHAGLTLKKLPSQYLKENFLATFIVDRIGVEIRHAVGLHSLAWSTDFPHHGNDYPYSRDTIAQHFVNVPDAERRLIVCDNAARLYGLI